MMDRWILYIFGIGLQERNKIIKWATKNFQVWRWFSIYTSAAMAKHIKMTRRCGWDRKNYFFLCTGSYKAGTIREKKGALLRVRWSPQGSTHQLYSPLSFTLSSSYSFFFPFSLVVLKGFFQFSISSPPVRIVVQPVLHRIVPHFKSLLNEPSR